MNSINQKLSIGMAVGMAWVGWTAHGGENSDTRYGWWGLLDRRSDYSKDAFPEPLLVDDTAFESDEFRVDWLHTGGRGVYSNTLKGEISKGFQDWTFDLEMPVGETQDEPGGPVVRAAGNLGASARHPVYQYVSPQHFIDMTIGAGLEIGIPVDVRTSRNAELVPKVFNDVKIGKHLTVQSLAGYSMLFGSGPDGGVRSVEYGLVVGYSLPSRNLRIPGVVQTTPLLEMRGETVINHEEAGQTPLIADAGVRVDLRAIGPIQPRLGIGYVVPLNNAGREQMRWGLITSLVFEY